MQRERVRLTSGRSAANVADGGAAPARPGSATLDAPALRTWSLIFHVRTVFLVVAGGAALVVEGRSGVGLAVVAWCVVVPYNLWLLQRTRAESQVPVLMAFVDQALCVGIAVLFDWVLPTVMIGAIIDLATAAQIFARRVVYAAVMVGSVGFPLVVIAFHPALLTEPWAMVSVAVFPVAGFLCAVSIGSLMERERETSRRFSALVEGLDAVVWRGTPDGQPTYVSGRVEDLFGYPREQWVADPEFWPTLFHPEDVAALDQQRAAAAGNSYQWTARVRAADGSERVVKTLVSSTSAVAGQVDVVLGLSIDVTDEHHARQALQERTREQEALVELAQLAASELDIERLYQRTVATVAEVMIAPLCQISVLASAEVLDMRAGVGWDTDVEARRRATYPPDSDVAGTDQGWVEDPLLEAHSVRASAWVELRSGEHRYGVIAVHYRDPAQLTPAKQTFLSAVAQLLATTIRRYGMEEQALRSRSVEVIGSFASGIAHDFNNLLMAVLGSAELLREMLSDADAVKLLADIQRAGWSATELCQQLLALAKGDPAASAPIDIAEVVMDTTPLIERLLGAGITLDVRAPGGHVVRSNPAQLRQLLFNLAINARDAMPDGGQLTIELEAVEGTDGPVTRLTFRDTGHGMDAPTLERARTAFFTTKAPGEGTGLGLATVDSIVRAHGGSLEIASEPGRGTTVVIDLPAAGVPAHAHRTAQQSVPVSPSEPLTILVVDDQAMVSEVIARALRSGGHHVHVAANLREAVTVAEGLPRLNLVFTDMVMPQGGGPEVAAALRSMRPELPVIFMSGYTDHPPNGDRDIFLQKPFTLESLSAVVERSLAP